MSDTISGVKKTRPEQLAAEVQRLREEEGLSLNGIAARLACSKQTVSRAAEIAGVRFDAESTRAMVESRLAGSRLHRARLAARLLDIADERLDKVADATPADGQRLMVTAAVALDKSLALERAEREDSKEELSAEINRKFSEDPMYGLGMSM